MAKVTLCMGIEKISGKVGNVCFHTMKSSGKIYLSSLPSARKTELKPHELINRSRFGKCAYLVSQMKRAGSTKTQKELWALVTQAL